MKKTKLWCAECGHSLHAVKGKMPAHYVNGLKTGRGKPPGDNAQSRRLNRYSRSLERPTAELCRGR